MALGREVDYAVHAIGFHELLHLGEVADVGAYERVVRLVFDVFKVGEVARVSELVDVHHVVLRVLVHQQPHHVAAYEPRAPGNDYALFVVHIYSRFTMFCILLPASHKASGSATPAMAYATERNGGTSLRTGKPVKSNTGRPLHRR